MTYCSSYKKGVTGYFIAVILLPVIVLGVIATGCRSDQRVILDRLPDVLDFKEEQLLAGQSMIEKLSYVSQLDQLDSTGWDEYRCSSSAALNCYLYMGGSWPNLVSLLGLSDSGLTYSNIHQSQERLFALAGGDSTGILGMYYPKWSNRGDLTGYQVKKNNLLTFVFENLGMYAKPILPLKISDPKVMQPALNEMYHQSILPDHADDLRNKKRQVEDYFKKNPRGTLFMGVNEDVKTAEIKAAKDERISSQNHYVMCFKAGGQYYILDTWRKPGQKTLVKLTNKQVEELLYNTHNMLVEVYFK